MTSTDYKKGILPTLQGVMFWKRIKTLSGSLYTYEDITLKLYIEIAKSGDITKLIKTGNVSADKCLFAWEELIKRNEKETGRNSFNSYFSLWKAYDSYINDHVTIRATLILVLMSNKQEVDSRDGALIWVNAIRWDDILWLKNKGHLIDMTSYETMAQSVNACLHKNENLVTKAVSKKKELEKIVQAGIDKKDSESFEKVLAYLNFHWPNPVGEDIKLITYNEYQKILKERQRAQEEVNRQR